MNQKIICRSLSDFKTGEISDAKKILLVTGRASFKASGAEQYLDRILADSEIIQFSDFETNPRLEDLEKGLDLLKDRDCIIAVGGGSVIDMAKLLKAMAGVRGEPASYILGEKKLPDSNPLPLIVLPTTSGSGSESTHFAVVYKDKVKYSLAHPTLLPDVVVLDPMLTMSMTSYQTACSGLDALAQSIESYWCVNATDKSRAFASEGISLVLGNLLNAVRTPAIDNKTAMQKGANLAGRAINISKTTGPHAFCYYLTSHFDIPHGHAAALMLVPFFIYNSKVEDEDSLQMMQRLYGLLAVENGEEASLLIKTILADCGLETELSQIMNISEDFEDFYASVNLERLKNNPRPMDNKNEFKTLLT